MPSPLPSPGVPGEGARAPSIHFRIHPLANRVIEKLVDFLNPGGGARRNDDGEGSGVQNDEDLLNQNHWQVHDSGRVDDDGE